MKKVLVIGDSCKDVFKYGRCDRLSPEAPVPVFKPVRCKTNGGMAMNTYANLKALGVECDIITNNGTTKTRYVDEISNQMLLRVDENDKINPIHYEKIPTIKYDEYSAIVISDYNKGFLSESDIEYISTKHSLTFLDTKKKIGNWANDIKIIKINKKEFDENAEFLLEKYNGELVVTLGKEGARDWLCRYPIENGSPVIDICGAGDTFLAALVADYIKNDDICSAIIFANRCASWVVGQRGVVVVDLDKMKL